MDKGTNKSADITITSSSNLSQEDIDKAVKEAEQYEAEDAKRKEVVDAHNQLDGLIFATEKALKEAGDKLQPFALKLTV
jgi:molecular chaperone DnaK